MRGNLGARGLSIVQGVEMCWVSAKSGDLQRFVLGEGMGGNLC